VKDNLEIIQNLRRDLSDSESVVTASQSFRDYKEDSISYSADGPPQLRSSFFDNSFQSISLLDFAGTPTQDDTIPRDVELIEKESEKPEASRPLEDSVDMPSRIKRKLQDLSITVDELPLGGSMFNSDSSFGSLAEDDSEEIERERPQEKRRQFGGKKQLGGKKQRMQATKSSNPMKTSSCMDFTDLIEEEEDGEAEVSQRSSSAPSERPKSQKMFLKKMKAKAEAVDLKLKHVESDWRRNASLIGFCFSVNDKVCVDHQEGRVIKRYKQDGKSWYDVKFDVTGDTMCVPEKDVFLNWGLRVRQGTHSGSEMPGGSSDSFFYQTSQDRSHLTPRGGQTFHHFGDKEPTRAPPQLGVS